MNFENNSNLSKNADWVHLSDGDGDISLFDTADTLSMILAT